MAWAHLSKFQMYNISVILTVDDFLFRLSFHFLFSMLKIIELNHLKASAVCKSIIVEKMTADNHVHFIFLKFWS